MTTAWETPLRFVRGVGPARARRLEQRLGLRTVGDLLTTVPRRVTDRSRVREVASVQPGEHVVIHGTVERISQRRVKRLHITEARVRDATGSLPVVWFNQPYLRRSLRKGDEIIIDGDAREYRGVQVQVREFEKGDGSGGFTGWIPVYPLAEGISQKMFRKIVREAVESHAGRMPEVLPPRVLKLRSLMPRVDAFRSVHCPPGREAHERGRRRLVYEELFALQAAVTLLRRMRRKRRALVRMRDWKALRVRIGTLIPHKLTGAQARVVEEIIADMKRAEPMTRLLQGDVGSGKTLVALTAALVAIGNKAQACLMAPTEVLARQHLRTIVSILGETRIRIGLLVGSAGDRRKTRAALQAGELDLVIGTHALLEQEVGFRRLGLVVIDEQHKFGVSQRARLMSKSQAPHTLIMTATPIPRTLTMTLYGDLDLSIIDEMPPGRRPPRTLFRPFEKLPDVCEFIRKKVDEGRQAYFVYPVIDPSEKLGPVRAATSMEKKLRKLFPGIRVGLLHGRMKTAEKEAVMEEFRANRIPVLVSTLVVEVGVDVPNATVMVVDNAERFGLSQLHQLRGRIGRGEHESYCILLGRDTTPEARQRIDAMLATHDGFRIAEEDLRIRGPGELLGTRQSGLPELRIADLFEDRELLAQAREDADAYLEARPNTDFMDEFRARFNSAKLSFA